MQKQWMILGLSTMFCAAAHPQAVRQSAASGPDSTTEAQPNQGAVKVDVSDSSDELFQAIAAKYRAENPKPPLPEEARQFKVQAEFAVQKKQFDVAVGFYRKALEIAPWWPEGRFNRALILGELEQYRDAIPELKRYLLLVPDAPDARQAQDTIYQWEGVAPAIEEAKKYGWLLGSWEVNGTWFSKATWDYGERHNHFQAEFTKSDSGADGYVIIQGAKSPMPAYKYAVTTSEEAPILADWQIFHNRDPLQVTSFAISSDRRTMTIVFLQHTFVFTKL